MEDFLATYGYFALAIGMLMEGEAMLIAAAFAAHRGYLNLTIVLFIAFVVITLLDWAYFFIGRIRGKSFLESKPKLKKKVSKVYSRFEKHPNLIILGFRFMYGFRILIPILLGTMNLSTSRFLLLSALSTLLWTILYGVSGYYLGAVLTLALSHIKQYEKVIILSLVALGILYWAYKWIFKKKEIPI